MGQNPSDFELKEMIREMDEDGSGTVDFQVYIGKDDFLTVYSKRLRGGFLKKFFKNSPLYSGVNRLNSVFFKEAFYILMHSVLI